MSKNTEEVTKDVLTIGGKTFEITAMRAAQITRFANILGRVTMGGRKVLRDAAGDPGDFIWAVLAAIDEKSLVDLAALLIGSDTEFAKDNFSLNWVVEALMIQIRVSEIGATIRNFSKLSSLDI